MTQPPNQSPEPTAVGAEACPVLRGSAVASVKPRGATHLYGVHDFSSAVAQLFSLGVAPHFMKTRYILFGLVALATTLFAQIHGPPYDNSKPPTLPLPAAYQFALTGLGSATNQLYCVEAHLTMDWGQPRWSFTFCSTNKPQKIMTVDFQGKVQQDFGARW